ncbi:MAG: MATE family efflux transporter [Ruminococcaceae bacterium]|nr:MATE family efflux transporter [Oscillospiraceae bacterium]
MKTNTLKHNLIGDKKFYRHVLAIVFPLIVQNTITNVVSLLDNVMVGSVGTLQMSAVAIVNQLIFVFNLCIFGGLAGAGIFSTQYAGAKDDDGVRYCFRMKVYIGTVMFAIATVIFTAFATPLVSSYLAEDTTAADAAATLSYGLDYLKIMVIGLLPFTVSQIYASTLRELGETKLPMIASIAAIFVNLVFNYILIFGKFGFPCLGVSGAAIATVMSRFVEAIIIIVAVTVKRKKFTFIKGAFRRFYIPGKLCKDIFTKGMPLLVNEFLWSAGMAVLLQCYSVRGLDVVAAVNISNTINNLFNVVFLSMGVALGVVVGQYLGAEEEEKAKTAVWRLIALSIVLCLIIGGIMALLAPVIPDIYNTENHVKEMATKFLFIVAGLMPIFSFSHCCYFTLRSGGRTILTFVFDSVFTWGVVVPFAYCLARFTSIAIVPLFFAVQSLEFLKCIVGFILVKKGLWIRNIISE